MADETIELNPHKRPLFLRIEVVAGPHAGEAWTIEIVQPITIGRRDPSHLRLPNDESASGVHCRLDRAEGQLCVTDLDSTNGTHLNGLRIQSGTMRPDDVLTIGQSDIMVRSLGPAVARNSDGTDSDARNAGDPASDIDSGVPEDTIDHEYRPTDQTEAYRVTSGPSLPKAFGNYDLLEFLGQGGMATVYRAVDRRAGEDRALKLIRSNGAPSSKQLSLFQREGALVTSLRHPRIVRAEEVGCHDEQPFLVMEYVQTVDLLEVMATLTPTARVRTAAWIISKLLQALHYAHGKGIVHRDVKISNLLAYREGHRLQVKLADFGLAKLVADSGITQLTNERSIRGTLAFMAPEQINESRAVGFTADIYAAGICLIRLLGGRLPKPAFDATGAGVDAVLENLDLPASLVRIIRKATAPLVTDRYSNAEAMAKDLYPFQKRRPR
jgi:serine/threonine protein kinase